MENGYVKLPIETYDHLKREIDELKAQNKKLEMRLHLQFTPGISAATISADKIKIDPNPYYSGNI